MGEVVDGHPGQPLGAHDLEIPAPHPPMEGELLALEAIEAPAGDPPDADGRIEVEEEREIRQHAAGGLHVHLADQLGIDAAPVALVGDGGVGVAVAEDDPARAQPRPELLDDVLVPRGHEQEHLGERARLTLEEAPHGGTERGAVGLGRGLGAIAFASQPPLEAPDLGRLARSLDALERHQHSAHGGPPNPRHCSMSACHL